VKKKTKKSGIIKFRGENRLREMIFLRCSIIDHAKHDMIIAKHVIDHQSNEKLFLIALRKPRV
jgi:hypothetical protein